jgi:hypothetical protein
MQDTITQMHYARQGVITDAHARMRRARGR